MFNHNNKLVPSYFDTMLIRNTQIHGHNTRGSANFHLCNPKTVLAYKSIRHRGPDVWHSLSNEIKACSSLYSFKCKIKKEIISSYDT